MKESNFPVMTMEQIESQAASVGCEVLVSKGNELQFDLDSAEAAERFDAYFRNKLSMRWSNLPPFEMWNSRSGNKHAVVTLPQDLTIPERIALQAAGGSDAGREFASLTCYWDGSPHPILLFKPIAKEV